MIKKDLQHNSDIEEAVSLMADSILKIANENKSCGFITLVFGDEGLIGVRSMGFDDEWHILSQLRESFVTILENMKDTNK